MTTASKIIITILSIVTVLVIIFALFFRGFKNLVFDSGSSLHVEEGNEELDGTPSGIDINVSCADVTVRYGSEFSVDYSMPRDLVPTVKFENGILTVKNGGANVRIPVNYSGKLYINVTIPEGTELDKASINVDAGNIDISGIKADTLTLDIDAGNIDVEDIEAEKIEVDCDAGNLDVEGCITDKFIIKLDAGNADIDDCTIDTIDANVDAGSLDANHCTINGGTCDVSLGNISLSGNIGDVKTNASLGNVEIH